MADTVCPSRPWVGYNAVRWVGHDLQYNSGGTGADATSRTYTSNIIVPPKAILIDIMLIGVTLWAGSSTVSAIVGDGDDDNGFIVATNLKSGGELAAGQTVSVGAGTALAGGRIGAYIASSAWVVGSGTYGRYAEVARTITAKISAAGTATAGRTLFVVGYLEFSGSEPMGVPTYVSA